MNEIIYYRDWDGNVKTYWPSMSMDELRAQLTTLMDAETAERIAPMKRADAREVSSVPLLTFLEL